MMMTSNFDSVKTEPEQARYHHGDLRRALLQAAEAVIAERGVDAFSLREAARRAGVSPAAPKHHFGDASGLLTAVATAGFVGLSDAMRSAADGAPDRDARILKLGEAYVGFALAEPARFDVMWRFSRLDRRDPAYLEAAQAAFALLADAVSPGAAGGEGDPRAVACWSLAHGFARLALDGAFGEDGAASRAAATAMTHEVLSLLRV